MPYNNLISRTDAAALIPEDVAGEIIQGAVDQSAVLTRFRRVTMSRAQQRMPVLSALPIAYWVDGDTGLKQTTEQAWANKYLNAEELAAIVPIPESVLEDVDFDLWGEIRPRLEEAVGRAVDAAVFFGTNAPGTFPTNVNAAAAAAGNVRTIGTATQAQGGTLGDLDELIALVEADGFDVSGYVAPRTFRAVLRRARLTTGERSSEISPGLDEINGDPVTYAMRGLWPTGAASPIAFAGDWSQFIVGVRRDMTYKVLTEAVIQDNAGAIVYNLAQQDMVALRITFRVAWQVANPITYDQPTEANRYPVGVLRLAP